MSAIFPEVRDVSNVGARYQTPNFLQIAVEGQGGVTGTAQVGVAYFIRVPSDADTYFGAGSTLANLIKFLLGRGITQVIGVASVLSATPPTLIQRQAAWATLEAMPQPKLRMTDAEDQATQVALSVSCNNASLVQNKHIGFGGLVAGSTKATLITAAQAINSKRFVLVGPGVYDQNNVLQSGNYAAAMVCAEVSKNPDIADDLDLLVIPNAAGIELGANGQPLFAERVVGGALVNDFIDLLAGGVSPLMTDRTGGQLRIVHLRMTFTGVTPGTDSSFDALETRLIIDQLFNDVRDYVISNNFLRKGNTEVTRNDLQAGIENLLNARSSWLGTVVQPDGTQGYNVSVTASSDLRTVTVRYEGVINRNIQVVLVDAELVIPV